MAQQPADVVTNEEPFTVIHLQRSPAPAFWTRERVKVWTRNWLEKDRRSASWSWPQYQGRRLNQYARETMEAWHHSKCAFCEAPLLGGGEIEHFRSKTRHPLAAFVWRNLFLICRNCNQAKGPENHEGCLKPDREDPVDYLWINPISRKAEPKPGISDVARQRAARTIVRYRLDRPELTKLYEAYLMKVSSGHLLPLMGLVSKAQEGNIQAIDQIPLRLAGLRALAEPDQPFSLMITSLFEYYEAVT